MSFGAPQWFWALPALPVLILLFVMAEKKTAERLRLFVSARLLPELAGQVNKGRRALRFALQLLALALALVSLAKPRWGYSFEEAHRRGIDIFIAVDTSRSMLSNDVQPNRLERVKLSTQDLINQLEGDRVGLIAFAGRAFVQAPLTIDYGAVVEAIRDLNTETIPEGGTNISEAIDLATKTYGKSATGNRALVIFTDGEDLSGDAIRAAKAATDQGVRIFTIGVGTPQGSLIPIKSEDAQSAFVKDEKGQVVKSKLDEKRLREIAETSGGIYLHLENGTRTMQQLISEGIAKIQAGDIDVRLNRRPIERYEWPLGAAIVCLAAALLLRETRKPRNPANVVATRAALSATLLLSATLSVFGAAPGIEDYNNGKFDDAYGQFQGTLQAHPQNPAIDRLNFDAGAAAYKLKDYNKALQSFSQALLSKDVQLQQKTHYNLGNTLYEQGETEHTDEKKIANWTNAIQHYDETLKIDPQDKMAQENRDFVKKKIEELKNKKPSPSPSPSPSPQSSSQDKKKDQDKSGQQDQQSQSQQQQKKDSSGQGQQQQEKEQQQKQQQPGNSEKQEGNNKSERNQNKDDKANSPSSSPSPSQGESPSPSSSGSPSATASPSPSPSESQGTGDQGATPSPSPTATIGPNDNAHNTANGEGSENQPSPSPPPNATPPKKFSGEVKGSSESKPGQSPGEGEAVEADQTPDGQMSERQAMALLQSTQDEEARVPLDERRAVRRVYKDW